MLKCWWSVWMRCWATTSPSREFYRRLKIFPHLVFWCWGCWHFPPKSPIKVQMMRSGQVHVFEQHGSRDGNDCWSFNQLLLDGFHVQTFMIQRGWSLLALAVPWLPLQWEHEVDIDGEWNSSTTIERTAVMFCADIYVPLRTNRINFDNPFRPVQSQGKISAECFVFLFIDHKSNDILISLNCTLSLGLAC